MDEREQQLLDVMNTAVERMQKATREFLEADRTAKSATELANEKRRAMNAADDEQNIAVSNYNLRDRCADFVYTGDTWHRSRKRCSRPRGHGKGGNYCKQHAKRYPEE